MYSETSETTRATFVETIVSVVMQINAYLDKTPV